MSIVTRFAPSPTGFLHLGHGFSAWDGWRRARAAGGRFRLRIEDIDTPRCRPAFAAAILEDLAWLGLDWDGPVRVQSHHLPDYAAALRRLEAQGVTYPCFCSRAEMRAALQAPHRQDAHYPGTCRRLAPAARRAMLLAGRPFAIRLDARKAMQHIEPIRFFEESKGWQDIHPAALDDIVLARKDIPASYHLCVVHDDAMQGVTLVTRGRDLAAATPVQVLLQRLLGLPTPTYAHHDLLTDADGQRLAKRHGSRGLRDLRAAGARPAALLAGFVAGAAAA